ncbi:hypothetical protein EVJ58_g10195 [Rhodofomes roseus]|uniref:DUF6589 domain-containing protein n=1 Tax=Rhodofomes roseus TaxID=34475 RepID=A0A4Y9XU81_9APHY|nr:hypothetical protein EVJ58_g10195 [Rhodofomes roseus]
MDATTQDEDVLQDLLVMSPLPPSSPLTPLGLSAESSSSDGEDDPLLKGLSASLSNTNYNADHSTRHAAEAAARSSVQVPPSPLFSTSHTASRAIPSSPHTPVASRTTVSLGLESSGPLWSTPIVGSPETKKRISRAKGQKQRKKTRQRVNEERDEVVAANAAYHAAIAAQTTEAALGNINRDDFADAPGEQPQTPEDVQEQVAEPNVSRTDVFQQALALLRAHGLTWGDLVLYVSDPAAKKGKERFKGMFETPGRVEQVLTYWSSSANSRTGRRAMHSWVMEYVRKKITHEGICATRDGVLQSSRIPMDEAFVTNFSLSRIHAHLAKLCPIMTVLLREFAMTRRQIKTLTDETAARNALRIGSALMTLLAERSQKNSYGRHIIGLYLYASGAQRQNLSVLSRIGLCSSYTSIAGTSVARKVTAPESSPASSSSESGASDSQSESSSEDKSESSSESESGSSSESESESSSESESESTSDSDDPGKPESLDFARSGRVGDEPASDQRATPDGRDPEHPTQQARPSQSTSNTQVNVVDDIDQDVPDEGSIGVAHTDLTGAGLLRRLSEVCRGSARRQARIHELAHVYDNINWILRSAEQIVGRKDSIENGTCATVFPLYCAPRSDMQSSDLLNAFDAAPPLSRDDILLNTDETGLFTQMLEHNLLRIITSHGGDAFARFRTDVERTLPRTSECIPLHKTEVYPLPAMNIEEASIKGNADVLEAIFSELGHDLTSTKFTETVKLVFGDQLSIARIRSVINNRMGHDSFAKSFMYTAFAPGLFHYQMAAAHGLLETHWGDSSLGPHDPASLYWHNTILDRKPFVLSNRPPYRVGRDLIFHSLYGRAIHCLELVTACEDLDNYAENTTFEDLQKHVHEIVARFINPAVISKLRGARSREVVQADSEQATPLTQGDMVFENACLYLRDALVLREFNDAIKAGDSGRLVVLLKVLALTYRGSGRTKYAQETLYLIHNLEHVWPKPLRKIILNNWLVNTTGKPNHWYPVDMLQEHNIFWTKTIYNAQGSGASWEWLEMISPCITVLRQLVTSMNDALGSKQGTKHAPPDLTRDIQEIRRSLAEGHVYEIQPGRIIDSEKGIVPNVVAAGLSQLAGPLDEYNKTMMRLKKRRRRTSPLVGAQVTTAAPPSTAQDRRRSEPMAEPTNVDAADTAAEGIEEPARLQELYDDDESDEEETAGDWSPGNWLEHEQLFSLDEEDDVDPYLD